MNRLILLTTLVSVFLVVAIFRSNKVNVENKQPQLKISASGEVTGPLEEARQNSRSVQDEVKEIESLLKAQDKCWNDQDIEGFMRTYWNSEDLTFSGGGKTTRGWKGTLEKYQTSYPPEKMGKLHFDELETTLLSDQVALVLGNWHLNLNGVKKDGNFSLVMKKLDGEWKIVHDHSSTLETEKGWLTQDQALQVGRSFLENEDAVGSAIDHWLQVGADESDRIWVNRKSGAVSRKGPE